jgi:large conductance mechanosensitive channel
MGLIKEFKDFIMRGNVIDMAVGVIMGGAFNKVVGSLVDNVMMPPIGYLMSGVDIKDQFVCLNGETHKTLALAKAAGAPVLGYGAFVNEIITLVITGFCIFMMIKMMNSMAKKKEAEPAAPAPPPKQEVLLQEIRDLLAKK